jgi:ubiquinone/menaquinone biosynthesis C-methylase UbiE
MSADRMALADRSFDLAVSVTVLQHLPDEIQLDALKEVRRVLVGGGRFLMLEATRDRGPHVFSNPPDEWIRKAASARFSLERTLPYDYAPLLYGLRAIASRVRPSRPEAVQTLPDVEDYVARFRRDTRQDGIARRLSRQVLHAATLLSYPVEPLMSAAAPASLAYHVGFLLRAV